MSAAGSGGGSAGTGSSTAYSSGGRRRNLYWIREPDGDIKLGRGDYKDRADVSRNAHSRPNTEMSMQQKRRYKWYSYLIS